MRLLVNAEGREIDSVERLFTEPDAPRVREAMDRFFDEVRALRRDVEADGAAFAVVVFPFRFQVEPGRAAAGACSSGSRPSARPRGCGAWTCCRRWAASGPRRSWTTTT